VTVTGPLRTRRLPHRAWLVAGVVFVTLLAAAGFRSVPGVLLVPLQEEFGWSTATISLAVSVNLMLFGLTAPFAAALMERFGMRRVVACALGVVAAGSGLTVFMTSSWQLVLCWGVLVGLGTGSMALVLAATVANRWFTRSRGLVTGILTAGSATGQLVFLPLVAVLADSAGWRTASLVVAFSALAVIPLVLTFLADRPSDVGLLPYGSTEPVDDPPAPTDGPARVAIGALRRASHTPAFWLLAGGFAICGATTNGLIATHFVPAAHDHGMQVTTAASLLAVVGVFDVVGTIASGWLTDRGRQPAAARRLLRPARARAVRAAVPVQRDAPGDHAAVHRLLRARLGGDRAADHRAVPRAVRRGGRRRVRLGLREPPDRRSLRGVGRRAHPDRARELRRRLARRRGAVPRWPQACRSRCAAPRRRCLRGWAEAGGPRGGEPRVRFAVHVLLDAPRASRTSCTPGWSTGRRAGQPCGGSSLPRERHSLAPGSPVTSRCRSSTMASSSCSSGSTLLSERTSGRTSSSTAASSSGRRSMSRIAASISLGCSVSAMRCSAGISCSSGPCAWASSRSAWSTSVPAPASTP
jgi:MFS family permease